MRSDALSLGALCCPSCETGLDLTALTTASDGHVMEGRLRCPSCGTDYPIRAGVPRFAAPTSSRDVENTVGAFGFQWQRASRLPGVNAPVITMRGGNSWRGFGAVPGS